MRIQWAHGQVIGNLGYDQGPGAFLWGDGGPMVDLNTLVSPNSGLVIAEAGKINDAGEITANAHDASGNDHALLLIPCDENHPGVEGCDYSLVEAGTTFVENALLVTMSGSLMTAQKAPPRGTHRPLRGRWAHR